MAVYDVIHHHATLYGTMFGGNEIWTTGFALTPSGGGDEGTAPTVAEAQAIATAFNTFWTTAANGINGEYKFAGCKVSHVSTAGTVDTSLTQFYDLTTPSSGAGIVSTPVPQISVVATLQTLKTRGVGSKGRMYIPGVGFSIDNGAKISTANCTQLANQIKTFLDAVNASTDVPGIVALMSREKTGVPFRAAEHNAVASVRVGNVYDTQRRRRNQLVETYQTAALA